MKIAATILLLFIAFTSFGQKLSDTLLKGLKPFELSNKEYTRQLTGSFIMGDGMGGFIYRFDSGGTFVK